MSARSDILAANRRVREGVDPKRRLDFGETTFRIPERDWQVLRKLYPALFSHDAKERHQAWKDFARDPVGELYRVVRSPRQVRQSDKKIIVT